MESEQESLDCPVCLEEYDASKHLPKMMPCLHTVCASCVLDLIRSRNLHKSPTMMTTSEPIIAPNRSNTQGINTNHMNTNTNYMYTNTNHMNTNTNYTYTNTNHMNTNTNYTYTNTNYMYTNNNTAAINTLATLMQRHPPLRRLSEQGRPPPVNIVRREPSAAPPQGVFLKAPASRTRPCVSPPAPPVASYVASPVASSVASPVGSPVSSPTAPPPVMPKTQAKELVIPKDLGVQCPLCRVVINTSSLQTNRYVMAHMKDLARLQRASASPTAPSGTSSAAESEFLPENFWCLACASPAKSACTGHDISPLQTWIDTMDASKDELSKAVDKRLRDYTLQLQETETMMKNVFHALSKASRRLWTDHRTAQDVAETLKAVQSTESTGETSVLQAVSINEKLETLRQLDKRVTELENGATCTDVFQWRDDNKLFISTREPERTFVITMDDDSNENWI